MTAVLFARPDSIYKTFPAIDVYDEARDARTFKGGVPVIAHPPCRAWSRMKAFAKPMPWEKDLARWAVDVVRKNGGVLEHPQGSSLWPDQHLPAPGCFDEFGGFTLVVDQFWWGHRARKRTNLYIVGLAPADLPSMGFALGDAPCVVTATGKAYKGRKRPCLRKAEREATPQAFAAWLLDVAARVRV